MADIASLQARRAAYVAAELKILSSQEYQVGQGGNQRRSRRAELEVVRDAIKDLDAQISAAVAQASPGARRMYNAIPNAL